MHYCPTGFAVDDKYICLLIFHSKLYCSANYTKMEFAPKNKLGIF